MCQKALIATSLVCTTLDLAGGGQTSLLVQPTHIVARLACRHQGVLNFPSSSCYVSLKALTVGAMCKLCRTEPDVATLAMHLNLAPALLQAIYDDTSTVYLKVSSCARVSSALLGWFN